MCKVMKSLERDLAALGYTVVRARRSGHLHVLDKAGNFRGSCSGTPSDRRSEKNFRSNMRKVGIPL